VVPGSRGQRLLHPAGVGRLLFGEHARRWVATWNTEATTAAKDRSIIETHVLPPWGDVPLSSIDHLGLQEWITALGVRRKPATVGLVLRLASAVLRSAVRNRLIAFDPAKDVRVPRIRRSDTDERIISRPTSECGSCPRFPTGTAAWSRPQPGQVCAGERSQDCGPMRSTSNAHGCRSSAP